MKRYNEYKDSGVRWIDEIPEHWEVKRLKHIFSFGKGLTITKANLKNTGIPCVNYGEIHSKFGFEVDLNRHKLKCVDESYFHTSKGSLLSQGDIVFADTSEDIEGAGNFTHVKSQGDIFAGYHTVVAKPVENIFSRFFAYQFDSINFRTQIREEVKGIKVYSITQSILKRIKVWSPPLHEQQQIVAYLDKKTTQIDNLIQHKEKKIELLKEKRTALINHVVTKGLNPDVKMKDSGVEWIGEIPRHWELKPLKYIVKNLNSGVSVNSEDTPVASLNELGILKTSCVYGDEFRPIENKKILLNEYDRVKCQVQGDTIIISRMNTPDLVGSSGYVHTTYNNLFLPDRLWITEFYNDSEVSVKGISYMLKSNRFRKTLSSRATGTSPSMKNISKDDFLTLPVPFYGLKEQMDIVNYLDEQTKEIDDLIQLEQKKIELLKEYRQALISEVVTGKVRVCQEENQKELN